MPGNLPNKICYFWPPNYSVVPLTAPPKFYHSLSLSVDRLCGLVVRASAYRSRGPGFDFRRYQIFWEVVSLERGTLSLVSIPEELLERINWYWRSLLHNRHSYHPIRSVQIHLHILMKLTNTMTRCAFPPPLPCITYLSKQNEAFEVTLVSLFRLTIFCLYIFPRERFYPSVA
jgi:hypothetical protein